MVQCFLLMGLCMTHLLKHKGRKIVNKFINQSKNLIFTQICRNSTFYNNLRITLTNIEARIFQLRKYHQSLRATKKKVDLTSS